jgi:hypothetical protein
VHAAFPGGVYFSREAVYSYTLHKVDSEGFVEQYAVASVPSKCKIQQLVKVVFYRFCERCMETKKPFCSYSY